MNVSSIYSDNDLIYLKIRYYFIALSVSTIVKFCRCGEEIITALHCFIMQCHI